jgi:hypothetical protein
MFKPLYTQPKKSIQGQWSAMVAITSNNIAKIKIRNKIVRK